MNAPTNFTAVKNASNQRQVDCDWTLNSTDHERIEVQFSLKGRFQPDWSTYAITDVQGQYILDAVSYQTIPISQNGTIPFRVRVVKGTQGQPDFEEAISNEVELKFTGN